MAIGIGTRNVATAIPDRGLAYLDTWWRKRRCRSSVARTRSHGDLRIEETLKNVVKACSRSRINREIGERGPIREHYCDFRLRNRARIVWEYHDRNNCKRDGGKVLSIKRFGNFANTCDTTLGRAMRENTRLHARH